jgi:hypothetical protein
MVGQMGRDGLDPDRAAFLPRGKRKYLADDSRFALIDRKNFLVLVPAAIDRFKLIAKRDTGAVPESLTGVLAHGPMDVFGVFARLMLVEDIQKLAKHLAAGVRRHGLGDRHQLNPRLTEFADVEL